MLEELKNLVKEYGMTNVSNDLGYRSNTTVRNWFRDNKIPIVAKGKVRRYLERKLLSKS
jgi:hypothetical protein